MLGYNKTSFNKTAQTYFGSTNTSTTNLSHKQNSSGNIIQASALKTQHFKNKKESPHAELMG